MNAIIEQTKRTISEKKNHIENMQREINDRTSSAGRLVDQLYGLKNEVRALENDLNSYFNPQDKAISPVPPSLADAARGICSLAPKYSDGKPHDY